LTLVALGVGHVGGAVGTLGDAAERIALKALLVGRVADLAKLAVLVVELGLVAGGYSRPVELSLA
jgi:hypothetical protein